METVDLRYECCGECAPKSGRSNLRTGRDCSPDAGRTDSRRPWIAQECLTSTPDFRSYNKASWEHERSIRWKRTATEILSDGWVYEAKGCTDIVIAFIGLCRAKGLASRFVKVRSDTGKTHSLAEIYHSGAWWLVETVAPGMAPIEGEMKEETPYKIWRLWRKGLDSWSIGLKNIYEEG